jgi:hypothetical protein
MNSIVDAVSELSWVGIILATLSTFVVGYIWYDKKVFGDKWMKLVGLSKKQMDSSEGMGKIFGMTALQSFLTAILLSCLLIATDTTGIVESVVFAAILGLVFRVGTHVMHNGFARRDDMLTIIDGSHDIVSLAVMGLILGIFI